MHLALTLRASILNNRSIQLHGWMTAPVQNVALASTSQEFVLEDSSTTNGRRAASNRSLARFGLCNGYADGYRS
eukprot:8530677-Pyramimonas_sp.AAC.1